MSPLEFAVAAVGIIATIDNCQSVILGSWVSWTGRGRASRGSAGGWDAGERW